LRIASLSVSGRAAMVIYLRTLVADCSSDSPRPRVERPRSASWRSLLPRVTRSNLFPVTAKSMDENSDFWILGGSPMSGLIRALFAYCPSTWRRFSGSTFSSSRSRMNLAREELAI
jgi:hypothetical protein